MISGEYAKISVETIEENKDDIVKYGLNVVRKNKSGDFVHVPVEKLNVLLGSKEQASKVQLYITEGWQEEIAKQKGSEIHLYQKQFNEEPDPEDPLKQTRGRVEELAKLSRDEAQDLLKEKNEKIKELYHQKEPINEQQAKEVVDSGADANVISKMSMEKTLEQIQNKAISEEDAKSKNKEINEHTKRIVDSIVDIVEKNEGTHEVFSKLEGGYSDGSTIAHSNRVLMIFVNFLIYYNRFLNMGGINKLRTKFKSKYAKFYQPLLPDRNIHSIEDVYEKGMCRIEEEVFNEYALGALIHDIGKVEDLEYFESASGRDMERIQQHVYNSYHLITKTSEYSQRIAMMAGFHHEYYGHESGYGLYRDFLSMEKQYAEATPKASYAVSYNFSTVERFQAMSYFPAKVLEVIDVFDALTDKGRKYRGGKTFTDEEAIEILSKGFVQKDVKVDPLILDIFIDNQSEKKNKDFSKYKICEIK